MAWFISVFLAVFALCPKWAIAESPEEFLINVVKFDFQGDPEPRAHRVTFSKKSDQAAYKKARALPDSIPEIYYLDYDPLVVVRDWNVIAQHSHGPTKFCIEVQFSVLARSKGKNLPSWENSRAREFMAQSSPISEAVRYCTVSINGRWMLLDPPVPRVEKAVVVSFLQKELKDAERRIIDVKTNDPRAIKNMQVIRDSLASQLMALEKSGLN